MKFGQTNPIYRWLATLSIHKISLIGANLAAFTVLIFASIIVHQEYLGYQAEVEEIKKEYQYSELKKQQILEKTQIEHKHKIMRYIIGVGSLSLFMYFTIFAISRVLSYFIEHEIDLFITDFKNSASDFTKLDKQKFNFEEFKEMAKEANSLIKEIQNKQYQLKILNASLEAKVKQKTIKLQNLVKAQDEFVKKSIHEINTPLAIIVTNIDLLKMKQMKNKQLSNIESASKIITNIFNDLSYLVKRDRVEYEKKWLNFSNFLRERLQFFEEVALSNQLDFDTNIENDLQIFINDVHLARIIDNNISNAIKYSFKDSMIKVNLTSTQNHYIFEIISNSPAIKDKSKLFEEYYREHEARGGFGLGLNIVKEICEENQVLIEIISKQNENIFKYSFSRKKNEYNVA